MKKTLLTSFASLLVLSQTAFPAGPRVAFMDSFASGRGNAFAATADNPSAVFYNPAGLTQIDKSEISGGAYVPRFSSKHTAPDGETTKMRDQFQAVPHFYYSHDLANTPYTFGIGAYLPFGLVTDWPDDGPFRGMATRSELVYLRINPVVAYQVNPQLSIGGGPTFNYSEIELRSRPTFPGFGEHSYKIEGDDTAIGFNVGARWQPQRQHAFGISYHSPTRIRYEGSDRISGPAINNEGDASMDRITFPEIVIAGYSYRPTPQWNLEVNIDWTRWSRFDSTTIHNDFGEENIPFGWKSTFMYGAGVTRYLNQDYFVSGGYLYAENAVPAETFNPFLPDSELHFFNVGFGSKGRQFTWHGGYQYAYGPSRNIPARDPADGSEGRYENHVHAFHFTFAYSF